MDAPVSILNLVRKAASKSEAGGEIDTSCPRHEIHWNPDPDAPADGTENKLDEKSCEESSCEVCGKKKSEPATCNEVSPKATAAMTATEVDTGNDKGNVSGKRIRAEARRICGNREEEEKEEVEELEEERMFVPRQQLGRSRIRPEEGYPAFLCIDARIAESNGVKRKIPRPANAFMLFANEWRKKLAAENPRDSNKDISVRLGILWKNMAKDAKEKYFALAREVDAEHKRKYPGTLYASSLFFKPI